MNRIHVLFSFFLSLIAINACNPLESNGSNGASEEIWGWQTYCSIPPTQNDDTIGDGELSIERVPVMGSPNRTLHLFGSGSDMRVRDLISARQWALDGGRFVEVEPVPCADFSAGGYTFPYDEGKVHACKGGDCKTIEIAENTWVYAYAAAGDGVIALTNFGEGLLFRDGRWCRMRLTFRNVYRCDRRLESPLLEPNGLQFYSSVRWNNRTLVGEFPSGRLYVFNGRTLAPNGPRPPFITRRKVGYEAQSMTVYCGNLYVGYWPTGEIWQLSGASGHWTQVAQLFPDSGRTDSLIPYQDRPPDDLPTNFFGRRVTSLVTADNALFASTSNYRGWHFGLETSVVEPDVAELYGAVFRIEDSDCQPQGSSQAAD